MIGKTKNELTKLDYQNAIQGPVPKDAKKLDIKSLTSEHWLMTIHTRGAELEKKVSRTIRRWKQEYLHFNDI